MILYLQMIPKSLILAHICLSLLNFSSESPAPCWIFASKIALAPSVQKLKNIFPPNCSFCVCSLLIQVQMLLGLFRHFHYLIFCHRLWELGPEPHSAWFQRPSFYTRSGQLSLILFARQGMERSATCSDSPSLSFPSLSLSSPRRKTNVFLLTYLSWGEGTACRPQWPWHSCSCQPAELPDFPLYRCWWSRQWHASFHLGWQLWSQCQPILPKKTFGNNMTVKANIGRTENNCTFF